MASSRSGPGPRLIRAPRSVEAGSAVIAVVGGINVDVMVRGPRLPRPGEDVEGGESLSMPGGKGGNQALAAARLGANVGLVGCVGSDSGGAAALAQLVRAGVNVDHVACDGDKRTGMALIHVAENGATQSLSAPGANRSLRGDHVRAAEKLISAADFLLVQLGAPAPCVVEAARIAVAAGTRVLVDPAPLGDLPDEIWAGVDVLRPNAREAERLTGIDVTSRSGARRAARDLIERGAGIVALPAGDEGNLVVSADDEVWLPRIAVESVDGTGAGDAFAAALAVALSEGRSLAGAAAFANAAAALTTTALGAQAAMPDRGQVENLLHRGGL